MAATSTKKAPVPKTVYETSDGLHFDTEVQWAAHESVLERQALIQTFLDAQDIKHKLPNGRGNPRRVMLTNAITEWLEFEGNQVAA
jgi:hypothetical protein